MMKYLFVICFLFQIYSTSANAQAYKYHTVKKGETVFSISRSYNLEEEDIYKYNPDAKEGIGVNEKLVIPVDESRPADRSASNSPKFKEHKVKKKETLYSLSKKYNVEIDLIKRFNKQLYSRELQMGETVSIPVGVETEFPGDNSILAQNTPSKPKPVSTGDRQITKTREHIVLPKETKYGIARKYGMTVKELNAVNPNVDDLQPGMMIRVGTDVLEDEPVIILDDRFTFYEVQPQETLFSLTRRFGVSIDSLKQLNPALKDGLKFGMVLKVPENPDAKGSGEDLLSGINREANTKLDLSNEISNRKTKEIVLMLPYHLNKIEEDSIKNYKNTILNERVVRISLDFYSGALMAVNKAKSMGISTNLRVYDTKQNVSEVATIINTNNFSNVDAVIGPLLQEPTEAVASRLEDRNIPVINPLSNRSMTGYQNLFQSIPSEEYMKNAMLEWISKNAEGKNVVVIADGQAFKIKGELNNILPNAKSVVPKGNYVADTEIERVLSSGSNYVILESENVNLVSSVTAALNRLARNFDITLLTTNKTNAFENDLVSNNHLGNLKFHYPSIDKEYDSQATKKFNEQYLERFGIEPNRYAIRGYDLTLDVLLRLASADDLYESFVRYPGYTEYYESKFHYLPNENGGFINDAIYILKLNKNLTISQADDF